jgi:hypothetical protein
MRLHVHIRVQKKTDFPSVQQQPICIRVMCEGTITVACCKVAGHSRETKLTQNCKVFGEVTI